MVRFESKAAITDLCTWTGVGKSSFHYKAHPGERGMKASTHTPNQNVEVPNADVVEDMKQILGQDFCVNGYQIMTKELRGLGYRINRKKVY